MNRPARKGLGQAVCLQLTNIDILLPASPQKIFTLKIQIKVIPSSSQDCITGWLENSLKIKVKAPPEKGKANKAVIKLLERLLCLTKGSVTIEAGFSSMHKSIVILNTDEDIIKQKIRTCIENNSQPIKLIISNCYGILLTLLIQ